MPSSNKALVVPPILRTVLEDRGASHRLARSFWRVYEVGRLRFPSRLSRQTLKRLLVETYNTYEPVFENESRVEQLTQYTKGENGRPPADFSEFPFTDNSRFRVLWDCLLDDPKVTGFEDRVREKMRMFKGPQRGKVNERSLFCDFMRRCLLIAAKRGFVVRMEGGWKRSAKYVITRVGQPS